MEEQEILMLDLVKMRRQLTDLKLTDRIIKLIVPRVPGTAGTHPVSL